MKSIRQLTHIYEYRNLIWVHCDSLRILMVKVLNEFESHFENIFIRLSK